MPAATSTPVLPRTCTTLPSVQASKDAAGVGSCIKCENSAEPGLSATRYDDLHDMAC